VSGNPILRSLAIGASAALLVTALAVPAAADADDSAAMFTGSLSGHCGLSSSTSEMNDDIREERGQVLGCFTWKTTDPRVSGVSTVVWNYDHHPAGDDVPGGTIGTARERIVSETGAWEGTLTQLDVEGKPKLESGWYVGEGEYDGLVFYVTLQDNGTSLWGYVSPEPPPVPEVVPEG